MSKRASLWIVLSASLIASPAYAYLDPASGSLLVQLLLGGLAGLSVLARIFWRRITASFRRGKQRDVENTNGIHQ